MAVNECAYCGERFASTPAFDRHLSIRRQTVTSPKGHVVPNEQVITCRPVSTFSDLIGKNQRPRLVRNAAGRWSTGGSRYMQPESSQTVRGSP